jgi:hypothetical protein
MPLKRRTIIYEHPFIEDLYRIQSNPIKADIFIEAVEKYLILAADTGVRIYEGSPVLIVPILEVHGFPKLTVFYTYNTDYVYCLSIREFS